VAVDSVFTHDIASDTLPPMGGRRGTALTDEAFQRLVDLAYEAGAEPERWPTFLAAYTELLGDRTASLSHHDFTRHEGAMAFSHRTDPAWVRSYAEVYAALNPWTTRGADQMRTGAVLTSSDTISDRELERTEFFNGFLKEQDVLYSLAAVIERSADSVTFMTVQASEKRGPFGERHIRFVTPLMPHLRRAFELHRRLGVERARREAFADVAERTHGAVFFVDRRGAVVFANASARRLGRVLTDRILAVSERGDGVVRRADGRPLFVRVVTLRAPASLLGVAPAVRAIFVLDPMDRRAPAPSALREMYGLTAGEATTVIALARGATLQEIANDTHRDLETVRSQIKRAFEKTGTRRQSELVALVLSLVPPV
jgi:DNA-binding CsgD family transcriptional regulator/PAS domain-containing protein